MSTSEKSNSEVSADGYPGGYYNVDSMSGKPTDIASGRKTNQPKVTLSAIVVCPGCGGTNKPEWMKKSAHSNSYATTVYCEQCGSLIAIWATHVDAQIVLQNEASRQDN